MPPINRQRLAEPVILRRAAISRGFAAGSSNHIDRNGGKFGAGLIRGFAVITRGEALGHGVWIDGEFLDQVAAQINSGDGVRARFTHPGMSGDGLGKKLGRVRNARRDGDVVRGDLHFSQTAHKTPDGDLASYVMDLAEEDPQVFGASIAFSADEAAEDGFILKHGGHGTFKSPDLRNAKNLPHARLSELRATDIVDEPAANPSGMFGRGQEIPSEADRLFAYALGLTNEAPDLSALGDVHPDRVRGFLARFLDNRGLVVRSDAKTSPPQSPQKESKVTTTSFGQQVQTLAQRIGPDAAVLYSQLGIAHDDARRLHAMPIGRRIETHDANDELSVTDLAELFGKDVAWTASMCKGDAFPEPVRISNGRTLPNGRYEMNGPRWSLSSVTRWLASGCPNRRTGRPNSYVSDGLGV